MKKYFPALTGVRAIAALLVFLFHATQHTVSEGQPFLMKWAIRLAQQGNIGVGIFFVLSGFLISLRYADSVELTKPWFRQYFQNRFARVYPVYFLLTALTFWVMMTWPHYDWDGYIAALNWPDKLVAIGLNLTLTRAYFQDMVLVGVVTAWTLTVEETFYVCAPFLLVGLQRSSWWLMAYVALLFAFGSLLVAACTHFRAPYGLLPSLNYMVIYTFFGRSTEFLVGMGLARWIARRPVPGRGGLLTLLGVAGTVACMVAHAANYSIAGVPALLQLYGNIALVSFPVALLLLGLVKERTWLQRLLQNRLFDLLGKSSYAFYLVHVGLTDILFCHYVSGSRLARLGFATLLSIGIYYWVEKPLQKRLRAKPWRRVAVASQLPA